MLLGVTEIMLGCFLICIIFLKSILVPEMLSLICGSVLCIRTVIRYGRVPRGGAWGEVVRTGSRG